jgi:hypothetical protein
MHSGAVRAITIVNGVAFTRAQLAGAAHSAILTVDAGYAAGFTGEAAGTLGGSDRWVVGLIAFSIGLGGGGGNDLNASVGEPTIGSSVF